MIDANRIVSGRSRVNIRSVVNIESRVERLRLRFGLL